MAEVTQTIEGQAGKGKRKRGKRPGAKRTSKMKREKKAAGKAVRRPEEEADVEDEAEVEEEHAEAEPEPKQPKKKRKPAPKEADEDDKHQYKHRVFVKGLPNTAGEKALLKLFGVFGEVTAVRLVRNSRLVFRGSAFVSFREEDSVNSALQLDGGDYKGNTIHVEVAEPPKKAPSLRVYVANVPFEADEKTLRKDFKECGEVSKLKMLKDGQGKFRGSLWITYAEEAGVEAALAYNGTDYSGRTLIVRRADAMDKPSAVAAAAEPELEEKALQREVRRARARRVLVDDTGDAGSGSRRDRCGNEHGRDQESARGQANKRKVR